jgi:ssDNA-binding Zn-finger/Zn-ribbon topoisomerase 1
MKKYKEIKPLLEQELDKSLVKQNFSGFDYLEGHVVIDTANKIFDHDGWSTKVIFEQIKHVPLPKTDKGVKKGLVSVPVFVTCYFYNEETKSIHEITKSDIGTCVWAGEEQVETGLKGAVTDGVKRALRQFGRQFGNDLYKKEEEVAMSNSEEDTPIRGNTTTQSPANKEKALMAELNMDEKQVAPTCEKCNSIMRLRKGTLGPFWGCGSYPQCRTIYNIDDIGLDGNKIADMPSAKPKKDFSIPELTPEQEKELTDEEKETDVKDVPF